MGDHEALRGLKVLVVEDEFLVMLDLQTLFEDAGAEVLCAASLEAGFEMMERAPDVALLDVRLGDGEVFPLARALDARDVPVVFHSGHARVEDLLKPFPRARALSKPAPSDQLLDAVRSAAG